MLFDGLGLNICIELVRFDSICCLTNKMSGIVNKDIRIFCLDQSKILSEY